MSMNRRDFVSLAAIGLALALMQPGGAAAADVPIEKMHVKMGQVPSFAYGGIYVALERGYFAERGLDVELVLTRGGDTAFQVAGGTLQFAGGSPDSAFFNGLKRGLPLMGIATLALNPPDISDTPLMVRKELYDSGQVTKVAQLKGRKIASLVPGGVVEYLLSLALKSGGLTMDDVQVIAPLGFPQMVDALATGAVDAALVAEPFGTMSVKKGVAVTLENKHDLGEQLLWIQTNRDFAKEHPNAVTNFLIAYLKAARDIDRETWKGDKIVAIMQKYTKVPPEIMKAAAPPVLPPSGALNLESIMAQQRYHMSRGRLTYKEPIPVEEFTDHAFLDRALAQLGAHK
ncbi:MAG TPA: ABC transporter substrate-binding protein [Alphaproteobacteria bacterium]|nr:ABC transporter substrate-binding protein [Alphaproteobacteria bacterium]